MPDLEKLVGLTITDIDVHKGAEDGTGFVYLSAIGADETPDIDDEIFDYKTSKPFVEAWSESSAETTKAAGQVVSYGNVRAQHGSAGAQNAAGTICEPIDFNDAKKRVSLKIKVVDADAITKVQEGVYRGVSIKGRLVGKKWRDGKFYRYTVDPVEFSLVDKPANPRATFTVVKADGTVEVVEPQETLVQKAAAILEEMSPEEVKELIMKAEEIEKASAISRMKAARKAHDENSACLSGYCGHESAEKCAEKVAENHKIIHSAFSDGPKKSADSDEIAKGDKKEMEDEEEEKKAKKAAKDADGDDDGDEEGGEEDDKKKKKKSAKKDAEEGDAAKSAQNDEIKSLKEQIANLTATVEKMAGENAKNRPTPLHPGSKVVTKSDEAEGDKPEDVIEKKSKLDKNDPAYVDKAYAIEFAAEKELVKL